MSRERVSNYFLCQVRRKKVEATAEERVRQHLLAYMIGSLGYPRSLLAVEKGIYDLVRIDPLKRRLAQDRRCDILVVTPQIKPLLLIECKASFQGKSHKEQALLQAKGYNVFIEAPYLLVASETEHLWEGLVLPSEQSAFFPSYDYLLSHLSFMKRATDESF